MNFNNIFSFFLPHDKIFYQLFEEVSNTLEEMAALLKEGVNESDKEKRTAVYKKIADLEHVNDHTTHKIFIELSQNFITPFDREDIHLLASTLDDIADFIDGASKRMDLYKIYEIDEGISGLCDVIYDSVMELKNAVYEVRNMNNFRITRSCVRINSLENKADDIFEARVAQLFDNEKDAIHIIKMKEILQSLEIATDKCEDVANVLESIVIKYT